MGDGRHRADPKGHGHYLAAALGVFLLVALLAGGGYTLHGALTARPSPPPTAAGESSPLPDPSVRAAASPSESRRASRDDSAPTLAVQVTGDSCYLKVTTPAGETLIAEPLTRGEEFSTDKPKLGVTIGDSDAVDVLVNGEPYQGRSEGGPATFDVTRED